MDNSRLKCLKDAILFYIPLEYNADECTTIRNILKNDKNHLLDLPTIIQILKQLAIEYVHRNFSSFFRIKLNTMILLLDGSQTYIGSYTSVGEAIQTIPEINKLAKKTVNELNILIANELSLGLSLECVEKIFS